MSYRIRKALAILITAVCLLLGISGCSSSSPPQEPDIPAPTALRTDLLYGYYGSEKNQLAETHDHINLHFAAYWDGMDEQLAQVVAASRAGIPVMLDLGHQINPVAKAPFNLAASEPRVRLRFQQLKDAGVLPAITALYPVDEPDLHGMSDDHVYQMNLMLRRVSLEFGVSPKIAVIYAAMWKWPGVGSYDWVGFDNYDAGARIFTNGDYDKLKAVLAPHQKIILVPGGADKWRTDPTQFFNKAQQDPQVGLIMPFIWRDNADPANGAIGGGIRTNGIAPAYRSVGHRIKFPK